MEQNIREYLSQIGRKGGKKSRRILSPEEARKMVRVREARKAYRRFHSRCFWSFRPDYRVTAQDLPWVVEQLRKHGDRSAWKVAGELCR